MATNTATRTWHTLIPCNWQLLFVAMPRVASRARRRVRPQDVPPVSRALEALLLPDRASVTGVTAADLSVSAAGPRGFKKTSELTQFAEYGLPLLFLVMLLMPAEPDTSDTPQLVDFFYSAFLFMIIVPLFLDSFAFMTLGKVNYRAVITHGLLPIAGCYCLVSPGNRAANSVA